MEVLNRIESLCLIYLRQHGVCPDARRSTVENGIATLRDDTGAVLAEMTDGIDVSESGTSQDIGMARVDGFVIRVRCHGCDRSTVRDSSTWQSGALWDCLNGHRNILPRSPLAKGRS